MTRLLPCSRNVPRECRRISCRAAAVWRPPRHRKVSYGDRQGALTFVNSIGSFLLNAPLAQRVRLRHVRLRISTLRKFAKFTLPPTSYLFIRRELLRPLRQKVVEERSDALPRSIGSRRHCVRRSRLRRRCVLQFGLDVLGRGLRAGRVGPP